MKLKHNQKLIKVNDCNGRVLQSASCIGIKHKVHLHKIKVGCVNI